MPQNQSAQPQAEVPGSAPAYRFFNALLSGIGYSTEVILHEYIGERRCRDMGLPLLVALGTLMLVTLFTAPIRRPIPLAEVILPSNGSQVKDSWIPPATTGATARDH